MLFMDRINRIYRIKPFRPKPHHEERQGRTECSINDNSFTAKDAQGREEAEKPHREGRKGELIERQES